MNLIFTSFYYNPDANKAHKVKLDTYLQNICVALISAKIQNPSDDVALIIPEHNAKLIEDKYRNLLAKHNILIKTMEFNYFVTSNPNKIWNFSFYRLSIMYELSRSNEYENICSIDSDTFTAKTFKDVWFDCKDYILLYDLNHSSEQKQMTDTYDDYKNCYGIEKMIINYGGEFVASSSKLLIDFSEACLDTFSKLEENEINYTHGDETVLAITVAQNPNLPVKNVAYFICRYWTGIKFKLLSTNYKYNPVGLYHVPPEKDHGLLYLYRYFIRHNKFPKNKKVTKKLGLKVKQRIRISFILKEVFKR